MTVKQQNLHRQGFIISDPWLWTFQEKIKMAIKFASTIHRTASYYETAKSKNCGKKYPHQASRSNESNVSFNLCLYADPSEKKQQNSLRNSIAIPNIDIILIIIKVSKWLFMYLRQVFSLQLQELSSWSISNPFLF